MTQQDIQQKAQNYAHWNGGAGSGQIAMSRPDYNKDLISAYKEGCEQTLADMQDKTAEALLLRAQELFHSLLYPVGKAMEYADLYRDMEKYFKSKAEKL